MSIGKAIGILVLCAVFMFVFFFLIRSSIETEIGRKVEKRVYFLCYVIFTVCTWFLIMAIWLGIYLIVG